MPGVHPGPGFDSITTGADRRSSGSSRRSYDHHLAGVYPLDRKHH